MRKIKAWLIGIGVWSKGVGNMAKDNGLCVCGETPKERESGSWL